MGSVRVTPLPLQLLIPSPSPIPEEEWAAAVGWTAIDWQEYWEATQARCSNERVHLGFPVLPRAGAGQGGASREARGTTSVLAPAQLREESAGQDLQSTSTSLSAARNSKAGLPLLQCVP